jgi:hypothetical protein
MLVGCFDIRGRLGLVLDNESRFRGNIVGHLRSRCNCRLLVLRGRDDF